MVTGRKEGLVLIVLLTVSTIVMMTVLGVCCVIGNRNYKLYCNQEKNAAVMMMEESVHDASANAFVA